MSGLKEILELWPLILALVGVTVLLEDLLSTDEINIRVLQNEGSRSLNTNATENYFSAERVK